MGHPWLESRYIYNTSLLIIINNCFINFKIYILVKLCQSSLSVILFWLWFLICNYLWYLHIQVCPVSWFLLNKIKSNQIKQALDLSCRSRDAIRLHNACFDNLLNSGHYFKMVTNSDPFSIIRCEQHLMIGKREIGRKAEDLGCKAVGGRYTQKAVDFRQKR